MDEFGNDIADQPSKMVSDTVINPGAELRKRRSTRIVQAVPLAVTGVDALGRPFVERTSSLIINCHGCRYQSKHYVLKNMWVTLEVPSPEEGQPPRKVRGRVAWIQRPRTVRQLFQVALELEHPGNVWGIAFPPEDWSSYGPGADAKQLPATGSELPPAPPGLESEPPVLPEEEVEVTPAHGPTDNLRIFPAPASTTDASLQLARQVARLIADAKQQIQASAREAAVQAVSAERQTASEQWEQKLAAARQEVASEASRAIERIHQETEERSKAAHAAAAEALRTELPKWLAPQLEQLTYELTRRLSKSGADQEALQQKSIADLTEKVHRLCDQAQEVGRRIGEEAAHAEARIRAAAEETARSLEETVRQHDESTRVHRELLGNAASEAQQELAAAMAEAQATMQERVTQELDAAQKRLQSAVESAVAASREQAAGGFHDQLQTSRTELQQQIRSEAAQHAASLREAASNLLAESERNFAVLRDSLQAEAARLQQSIASAQDSIQQLEQNTAKLTGVQENALAGFQAQLDEVLTLQRNELQRRSESIYAELNARIEAAFGEATRGALASLNEQVRAMIEPQVTRADEAMQRLAGGRALLEAATSMQQERIRTAADEAFAESLGRFRENLGGVEQLLHESAQSVVSRHLTELESKASDVRHQAVEEMYKSAEWYEKKAQTQIAAISEKAVEQASNQLRERAGEVSSVFAAEVDHASRNFVEHTQAQMAEAVHDAFERTRALFAEAADTTSAAFTDEIQRHARMELEGFRTALGKAAEDSRSQIETSHSQLTRRLTAEQEEFLRRFQAQMSSALESGVSEVQQKVREGLGPILESWKTMTGAYQEEMRGAFERMGNQAAEQHRSRLENTSNSWLVATVAMLNHQSQDIVSNIAKTAEEKLRVTCAEVFAGVGDSLRERLQQIATGLGKKEPPGAG
jgi:hypothetical protein